MVTQLTAGSSLCDSCIRKRAKVELGQAEQGLIECRLDGVDAALVLEALYSFASTRKATVPFLVEGFPEVVAAWPLQFHPMAISRCEGRQT